MKQKFKPLPVPPRGVSVFYLGADPELFLMDKKQKKFVSAHEADSDKKPLGSKEIPVSLFEAGYDRRSGSLQVDGLALEFNTLPCSSSKTFNDNVSLLLRLIKQRVKNYDLDFSPTCFFDKDYYDKCVPSLNKILGCTPDYNAYTGDVNPAPTVYHDAIKGVMRSAGGHLHLGWATAVDTSCQNHFRDCAAVVRNYDAIFRCHQHMWDKDTLRQEMYGKPGAFRPKPYGVEYRSPSNAWLAHPKLWPWLFDAGAFAYHATVQGRTLHQELYESKGDLSKLEPVVYEYSHTLKTAYGYRDKVIQAPSFPKL